VTGGADRPARARLDRAAARLHAGSTRVRGATGPVLLAAVAASAAYAIAHVGLGQPAPFFAPAAAWISLGFTRDRQVRRVAEMAIGVSLGVALGEVLGHALGAGVWQVGLALTVAALLARLLDAAALMTTQAGLQAIIIVTLPATLTGGSFGRWIDAIIGGAVALVVAVLVPGRSWRRARAAAEDFLVEVAGVLAILAGALRRGDVKRAGDALASGRASDAMLQRWRSAVEAGQDAVRFSPVARRHRAEIALLARTCTLADHAMRNTRVVTRRSLAAIEEHGVLPVAADVVGRLAVVVAGLGRALGTGEDVAARRDALRLVAVDLRPERYPGWRAQSLVVLLRSLVVDLFEITGLDYEEAKLALQGADATR
jgi:hypothetical protein